MGEAAEGYPIIPCRDEREAARMACRMVKDKEADAFVSAGSSGAVLAGGQLLVGRIKGVERPPLAPLIPTEKGFSILIDCGANVDARPSHLVQFAKMGSIYMEHVMGVKNPKVAIVNIGAEEEKGKFDFVVSRAVMPLTDLLKIIRKNISSKQQNALPNGLICLKGGELGNETMPVKNKTTLWDLKEFFEEEFFETKKVVYVGG